ncbi:MAG: DUF308 domain-containing protein [Butyrivibrio sp.]|nr:DUF308 domain-containing protein [Butyrivibrio sp.]
MREALKKMRLDYIIQAAIVIVIGLVLIIWTRASLVFMARALAVLLILVGAIFVVAYFMKTDRELADSFYLVVGILIAAIGAWIFVNPGTFTDFIPKLFGVFILASGIRNVVQTISLFRHGYSFWWVALVLSFITLALGAVLLFNPTGVKEFAVTLIGIFLVYDGVSNLWTLSRVTKYVHKVEQAIRDSQAVDVEATVIESDSAEK